MRKTTTASRTASTTTPAKTCWIAGVNSAGSVCRPAPIAAFAIAPKTATPTADPSDRANRFAPVTTPRSLHPTEDCAATSVGGATSPMPIPMTKHVAPTCATDESRPSNNSRAVPAIATTAPIDAQPRKPSRR